MSMSDHDENKDGAPGEGAAAWAGSLDELRAAAKGDPVLAKTLEKVEAAIDAAIAERERTRSRTPFMVEVDLASPDNPVGAVIDMPTLPHAHTHSQRLQMAQSIALGLDCCCPVEMLAVLVHAMNLVRAVTDDAGNTFEWEAVLTEARELALEDVERESGNITSPPVSVNSPGGAS